MAADIRDIFMIIRAKDQASRVIRDLSQNVSSDFNRMSRQAALHNRELTHLSSTIKGQYGTDILRQQKVLNGAIIQGDAARARGARQSIRNLRLMEASELQEVAALRRHNEAQQIANIRMREQAVVAQENRRRLLGVASAFAVVAVAGAAVVAAGVLGLFKLANATTEYNHQTAITLTQTTGLKTSVQQLRKVSDGVAASIGLPLEQLQPALYDIFSSMNVNVKQSALLLRNFAKEAVAGNVSIQDAGRATIGIMNAFQVPVSRVSEVLDFQFRLVEKGVGTFGQFATTIGRAVPSAVRAGQSYKTLGGMLAFLTRNGLSAAMASASAGRALDAISNAKVVGRLAKFGEVIDKASGLSSKRLRDLGIDLDNTSVKVVDSSGKFRPLVDVMGEFAGVLIKLPPASRVAVLAELFKGAGGTIQARRFFDVVIKNFPQFRDLVNQVAGSANAMNRAYKKASDTVQVKTELLKNRLKLLRNQLSDDLQPAFRGVVDWMIKLSSKGGELAKWVKESGIPGLHDLWGELNKNVVPEVKDLGDQLGRLIDDLKRLEAALGDKTGWHLLAVLIGRATEEFTGLVTAFDHVVQFITTTALLIQISFFGIQIAWGRVVTGLEDGALAIMKVWRSLAKTSDTIFHTHLAQAADAGIANMERMRTNSETSISKLEKQVTKKTNQIKDNINAATSKIKTVNVPVGVTGKVNWTRDAKLLKELTGNFTHKLPAFAAGGRVNVGTTPTADDVLARVSRDETIVPAMASRRPEFKAWATAMKIPGFASGGIAEVRHMPALRNAVVRGLELATQNALSGASKLSASPVFNTLGANASVAAVAAKTVQLLGRPFSEVAAWSRRIMFESGGNWSAVNRSDINWIQGHPSVGGAQVIRGTFQRWAGPFRNVGPFLYGVSTAPLANSYAGANYAIHRYGSLAAVDPRVRPIGYDRGNTMPPGLSLSWNGTGRPERLTPESGGLHFHFHGPVYGGQAGIKQLADDVHTALLKKRRGWGGQALGLS